MSVILSFNCIVFVLDHAIPSMFDVSVCVVPGDNIIMIL